MNCTVGLDARYISFVNPTIRVGSSFAVLAVETIQLFIIEKNSKVRQALKARLGSSTRIEVVGTAQSPREAIQRFDEFEPDVILLDAKTAGRPQHVASAINNLRKNCANTGIIVLTSYAFEREREAALDSGAAQYLLKDIDSEALIREIEALGKSRVQEA